MYGRLTIGTLLNMHNNEPSTKLLLLRQRRFLQYYDKEDSYIRTRQLLEPTTIVVMDIVAVIIIRVKV